MSPQESMLIVGAVLVAVRLAMAGPLHQQKGESVSA